MKHPIDAVKIFKDWLKTDDCYPVLESWGKRLTTEVQRLNLPENVWPYSRTFDPQVHKDVIRDFWIFLTNYSETLSEKQNPQFESLILKGDIKKILNTAFQAYIQTKKAEARKKGGYRYVYRRVRETLKEEKNIHYQRDKKGWPYYSLDFEAALLNNLQVLHSESYSVWESPLNIISEMEFSRFKREYFLELSIFFWKQAVSKLGKPYFLPIREVVNFLAAHYQTIASTALVSMEDLCYEDDEGGESKIPSPRSFEVTVLESTLEPLAEALIESWPYKRKVCFSLKYENPDISFRDMANELGLKRHSNTQYHYETAISKLKDFCSEWPGPTLPDIEKDLFLEFINKVAELCKKSLHGHKQ
ncbi:MAG: hypothetical protein GY749_36250 [Desulfobacteraceae bacterium]|nr:hypothetical protein [Desulfobacteraceae bacterium]